MTYAPADLLQVRSYLVNRLDLVPGTARGIDLEANEVGIVGDPKHAASGGYHEGNDDLARVGRLSSDYSKRESARDRPGTNGASAIDIGWFDVTFPDGRRLTLRTFSAAIDAACRRKDPRARDVRELIWSPDGKVVRRFDALGIRSAGDLSHLTHTHGSFFRDSEGRRARPDNFLGLVTEIIEGKNMAADWETVTALAAGVVPDGYSSIVAPEWARQWMKWSLKAVEERLTARLDAVQNEVNARLDAIMSQPPGSLVVTAEAAAVLGSVTAAAVRDVLGSLDNPSSKS